MAAFSAAVEGVELTLEDYEADLLRGLMREMRALLGNERDHRDPVVARLFPDAYSDEGNERAYRELVGGDLRDYKLDALTTVELGVGREGAVETKIEPGEAQAWLTTLTDMRLAIGTRLDVTEETMAQELEPGQPDAASFAALHWLGWMQGSLIEALTKFEKKRKKGTPR